MLGREQGDVLGKPAPIVKEGLHRIVSSAHDVVLDAGHVLDGEAFASHRRDGGREERPKGIDDLPGIAKVLIEDERGERQVGPAPAVAEDGLLVVAEDGKAKRVGRG